jgi:hypothetical protein
MGAVNDRLSFVRPTFGSIGIRHNPSYLRRTIMNGLIKIYDEGKAYNEYEKRNHGAERMEIIIPEGKICILKDYQRDPKELRYKGIECYNNAGDLLDSISIIQEPMITYTPNVRFYYGRATLGRGSGDIGIYIAAKMLGDQAFDPRYSAGSHCDEDLITQLMRIYHRKYGEVPEVSKNIRAGF